MKTCLQRECRWSLVEACRINHRSTEDGKDPWGSPAQSIASWSRLLRAFSSWVWKPPMTETPYCNLAGIKPG